MQINLIQSSVTRQWNYCPDDAPASFKRVLCYDDTESGLLTSADAISAAKRDKSIPRNATFSIFAVTANT